VHCDLKPKNLTFNSKGYLKITDFGISRSFDPKVTNELQIKDKLGNGTMGFMAPEVLFNQTPQGPAIDWFALGVLAYSFMLGRNSRPYQTKD